MPAGIGGWGSGAKVGPQGGGGGGNYPQPPPFPAFPGGGGSGSGAVDPNMAGQPGYVPGAGGAGSIPGVPGTPPSPPNITDIQANPQLMEVYSKLFSMGGSADPFLMKNIANIEGRMDADTTQRAIDRASGTITDQLAGALQANKERGQGRGGGGTAAGAQALTESSLRNQARASADISLGREKDLDALALGAGSAYAAPGNREAGYYNSAAGAAGNVASNQLGGAQTALQAWQAAQNTKLQEQQLAMQQQQAMIQMYSNLWS